jgi:hypothetical protein
MRRLLALLPLLALAAPGGAAGTKASGPDAAAYTATARLIAGIPSAEPGYAPLEARESWAAFSAAIEPRWQKLEGRQLTAMRRWTAEELAPRTGGGHPVFYPFSGPDLINPMTILPGRADTFLLSLEPVGRIPDLTRYDEAAFDAFFAGMQESLSSMLAWDFFQTRELREDLTVQGLDGVLPLLLFFAARDGMEVRAVHHVFAGPDGALREVPSPVGAPPEGEGIPGVRLTLGRPGSDAVRRLHYFQVDLSDHSLQVNAGFFDALSARGPFVTYLKAASYLMFKPKYSAIERFILAHSRHVLQDDTGVPVAAFEPARWDLRLYGSYDRPIRLFDHRHQPELEETYRTRTDVAPLPFSVGYEIRPHQSNLMLATRREPLRP